MQRNRDTIAKHLYLLQTRRTSKLLPLLTTIFCLSSAAEVYALDNLKLECDGTYKTEEKTLPALQGDPIHFTVNLTATSLSEFTLELSGPVLFTNSFRTGKFENGQCVLDDGDLCISEVHVNDGSIDAERLSSFSSPNLGSGFSDWELVHINRSSGEFSFYHKHTWQKYPSEYRDGKIDAKCAAMGNKKF